MKKISTLLLSFAALLTFIACNNKKSQKVLSHSTVALENNAARDSTVYGTMVDGGMNSILLQTDKGDTIEYLINPNDTIEVVKGGKLSGDRFAVISYTEYGDRFVRSAINITSLLGTWTSLDKNFEIKEGGTVASKIQSETDPWTSWKLFNGKLILSKDTFEINQLGADSLALENANGIFVYKRDK